MVAKPPYGTTEYEALPSDRWRLYYADGSTFDSSMGAWSDAPSEGVQILLLFAEPPYRTPVYGFDHYRLPGGDPAEDKRGSLIADGEFYALQTRMLADEDWPV